MITLLSKCPLLPPESTRGRPRRTTSARDFKLAREFKPSWPAPLPVQVYNGSAYGLVRGPTNTNYNPLVTRYPTAVRIKTAHTALLGSWWVPFGGCGPCLLPTLWPQLAASVSMLCVTIYH